MNCCFWNLKAKDLDIRKGLENEDGSLSQHLYLCSHYIHRSPQQTTLLNLKCSSHRGETQKTRIARSSPYARKLQASNSRIRPGKLWIKKLCNSLNTQQPSKQRPALDAQHITILPPTFSANNALLLLRHKSDFHRIHIIYWKIIKCRLIRPKRETPLR